MSEWQTQFALGRSAENRIAAYLRARGNWLLPAYEAELDDKGPRILTPRGELISTDFLLLNHAHTLWIEAKWKTRFSWHRKSKSWQTGIDRRHYRHYLQIAQGTPFPVWLLFLHENPVPRLEDLMQGSPDVCPTGLFGGELGDLSQKIDHPHNNWGREGMIYWRAPKAGDRKTLLRIASLEEIEAAICNSAQASQSLPAPMGK